MMTFESEELLAVKDAAVQTSWSPGRFDDLLLAVADEKARPRLWMAANGAIFAPYNGGVDLFLPDVTQVQRMSERQGLALAASSRPIAGCLIRVGLRRKRSGRKRTFGSLAECRV